jgi:cell division protein FtsN
MNYHLSFSDIDHLVNEDGLISNDNFTVVNFTLHYDLFTPKPDDYNYYDETNYTNVNFKAMDLEDHDSDGVADIDDNCPSTPNGVKVNEYGCPFDGDNDGVPNYLDEELNTIVGAVVNERGIQLTDEEFHSMYSEYESASREYAKFYNESEIRRDNFKTINEYLIAKANAFNLKYNESNQEIERGKRFKVQIGRFADDIPSYLINKFLSYEDLESIPQQDGTFIYAVGEYQIIDDAENRQMNIETKDKLAETKIIVVENGTSTDFEYNFVEDIVEEKLESITTSGIITTDSINTSEEVETETISENKEKVIYRVQLGYFERELASNIFEGLNVIPVKKGNGTFYLIGSFTEHQEALIKQSEMKARGFNDAFIVTYKNGERINISAAITTEKRNKKKKEENRKTVVITEETSSFTIQFIVQIGVWNNNLNSETEEKVNSIGGAEKVLDNGNLYKYIAGRYNSLSEAEFRKSEVSQNGFSDAFIYAEKDGERIKVKEAVRLLNK